MIRVGEEIFQLDASKLNNLPQMVYLFILGVICRSLLEYPYDIPMIEKMVGLKRYERDN